MDQQSNQDDTAREQQDQGKDEEQAVYQDIGKTTKEDEQEPQGGQQED